jgi:hypothetical protein
MVNTSDRPNHDAQLSTPGPVRIHAHLKIEYVNPGSISPNPHPTKKHSKKQIEQIAASIRQFGIVSPLLVDSDQRLIAGEAVLAAAKLVGLDLVPVTRKDDLTEPEKRALALTLNRLSELSSWDEEALKLEFNYFLTIEPSLDFDLAITGFETADQDRILSLPAADPDGADDIPEIPEGTDKPVSSLNDLWHLGDHRFLHGDARNEPSYVRLMGGELAQLVACDPPYNVPIQGHVSGRASAREFPMASGEMSPAEFTDFLTTAFKLQAKYSIDGSAHFQFMDWRHMREMLDAGHAAYDELINLCVWVKDNAGMGSLWRSQHELIFVWKKGKGSHRNNVELGKHGRWRSNVWRYPGVNGFKRGRAKELGYHATPKSVSMIVDAIKDCSDRGGVVLDTFIGSGTTLIAAERTGRRCFGMDLDGVNVDIAIKRWQEFTGKEAVHADTNLTFAQMADRRASEQSEPDAGDDPAAVGGPVARRRVRTVRAAP